MSNLDFFKFPSTPHLLVPEGLDVRRDKIMSEEERLDFLSGELIVEEKVDGANLGISFDQNGSIVLQNRGTLLALPYLHQWKKLDQWLAPREDSLFDRLGDRLILFGEWCYAVHSIFYSRLPDWFLGFDIFDKEEGRFFSLQRRNVLMLDLGIEVVPQLARGAFSLSELDSLFRTSAFGDTDVEGLYLRRDEVDWLLNRAKIVRPTFSEAIEEHWMKGPLRPNRVHPIFTR